MKKFVVSRVCVFLLVLVSFAIIQSCEKNETIANDVNNQEPTSGNTKIIFLHHSTGQNVWDGGVASWFSTYNTANGKNYQITERSYPSNDGYGWNNYAYDYWNIWVKNAGSSQYMSQDTLEILTRNYNVIVLKHCYHMSDIFEDEGDADITSADKEIQNYKLQYNALKEKMHTFPNVRFLVWTGAARTEASTTPDQAARAREFFQWVMNTWDEAGDNIYVFDFFELETEGGNYLKDSYATNSTNSHPKTNFCETVAPYFCKRIVDVIEGRGDTGSLTGK